MQRTGAAGIVSVSRTHLGAAPAADRPNVMSLGRTTLRIGVAISLVTTAACVVLGIWASRAELLYADDVVVRGHPFLAWHEGHDLRFSVYGFEPWAKRRNPDILSGPYWRFDPVFEVSLWKPLAGSLVMPLVWSALWFRRRVSRVVGFEVIPAERRAT
jgi:hypothetical protein